MRNGNQIIVIYDCRTGTYIYRCSMSKSATPPIKWYYWLVYAVKGRVQRGLGVVCVCVQGCVCGPPPVFLRGIRRIHESFCGWQLSTLVSLHSYLTYHKRILSYFLSWAPAPISAPISFSTNGSHFGGARRVAAKKYTCHQKEAVFCTERLAVRCLKKASNVLYRGSYLCDTGTGTVHGWCYSRCVCTEEISNAMYKEILITKCCT